MNVICSNFVLATTNGLLIRKDIQNMLMFGGNLKTIMKIVSYCYDEINSGFIMSKAFPYILRSSDVFRYPVSISSDRSIDSLPVLFLAFLYFCLPSRFFLVFLPYFVPQVSSLLFVLVVFM